MSGAARLCHPFPPLFDAQSRVLILGSFPSVRSREQRFFYGHPQSRFWPMLAAVYGEPVPVSVPEKRALVLRHGLALWDVIASCEIEGSSDASIRSVVPNDLGRIFDACDIRLVCCNGTRSHQLYGRTIEPHVNRPAVCLPSTSPANARWTLAALTAAWSAVLLSPA